MQSDTDLLTAEEVAPMLRLSSESVRRMIREGRIVAVKIGRRYMVSRAEVERVKREGTHPAGPSSPVVLAGGRVFDRSHGEQEGGAE
jgi:excisionase family DNA binding protein